MEITVIPTLQLPVLRKEVNPLFRGTDGNEKEVTELPTKPYYLEETASAKLKLIGSTSLSGFLFGTRQLLLTYCSGNALLKDIQESKSDQKAVLGIIKTQNKTELHLNQD